MNIENGSAGYDAARDCPNDNCVVAQITKDEQLVGDKTKPAEVRAEALRFLIHFVGDIHQPLHDADNHDRGGNAIMIDYNGRHFNLHSLWDDLALTPGPSRALMMLVSPRPQKQIDMAGTPIDWDNEGYQIAEHDVYRKFPDATHGTIEIAPNYVTDEGTVIRDQLTKAGLRLA